MTREIYAWILSGQVHCHNPHAPGAVALTKEETIAKIKDGSIENKCDVCELPLVSCEDLEQNLKMMMTNGS